MYPINSKTASLPLLQRPIASRRAGDWRRQQTGSSLLEVLVAVLIVSFGVLGLVGLQIKSTSMSIAAEDRSRAALLANDFVSTMQLMRAIPSGTALDDLEERAQNMQAGGLPEGEFLIEELSSSLVAVTVQWTPTNPQGGAEAQTARHTTVAVLPQP